jgi:hypothetical protein
MYVRLDVAEGRWSAVFGWVLCKSVDGDDVLINLSAELTNWDRRPLYSHRLKVLRME